MAGWALYGATIFFLFTPIAEAQSELLARTSPTIYDVFIALFGGLAGVVALSTKEKGNVIPGVAIATALMPPLCTAGYGLASGNLVYFLGAFYLYFINSVFISLATFIGVRVMHFQRKEFVDKAREKMVRKYIILIVVLTMCPKMTSSDALPVMRSDAGSSTLRNMSTSSSMLEVVAELPMLVLIFTKKLRPIIIGSDSG